MEALGQVLRKMRGIYYGWVLVAVGFVIYTVAFAIPFSFAIFFKPLQDTFGWSRATVSWAMTFHLITFGLVIIPAGWAFIRFKARNVYIIAALMIGVTLILASRISQPWHLYILYGIPLGAAISICGPQIMSIITRWFVQKRGLALGISSAGVGFGTLIGAPITHWLIESYGWRNTFIFLGIGCSLIILTCAFFMKSSPPTPLVQSESSNPKPAPSQGLTFWQAIRTREMLFILVGQTSALFTLRIIQVHIAAHATDIGISAGMAALAVGTIGGAGTVGRLVMGYAQDKIGAKAAQIICLSVQGVTLLLLPFLSGDALFFAFALVFGFTYGGDMPQVPALTAQCFGVASIGLTYGLVIAVGNLVGATGPIFAGYVFDNVATYTPVFITAGLGLLGGVYAINRLKLRK